jgi:hypothetical protein
MNDFDRRHTSDGFDPDAIFADIVAHINDDPTSPAINDVAFAGETSDGAPDETIDDLIDETTGETIGEAARDEVEPAAELPQALPTPQIWRAHEVDEEYDEHFEPQPVAPLPVGDLQFWAIIAGMGGGPLLLLYFVFFNRDANRSWMLIAIAMSVGGFVMLVSRLPRRQGDDDDGARI